MEPESKKLPTFDELFLRVINSSEDDCPHEHLVDLLKDVVKFVEARKIELPLLMRPIWELEQLWQARLHLMCRIGAGKDILADTAEINEFWKKEIGRLHENCASTLTHAAIQLFEAGNQTAAVDATKEAMYHAGMAGSLSEMLNQACAWSIGASEEQLTKEK